MKKCLLILMAFLLLAESYAQEDTATTNPFATLAYFQVRAIDKVVQLKWSPEQGEDLKSFDIERSEDGLHFTKIGSRLAISKSADEDYEFVDATPAKNGSLYYRVKLISKDGFVTYSKPEDVKPAADQLFIRLKQNPVRSSIDFEISVSSPKQVSIAVVSQAGQQVIAQTFRLSPGINQLTLPSQTLYHGLYRLAVDAGSERKTLSFIKE